VTYIRLSRLTRTVSGLVIVALILPLVPWSIRPCEAQVDYVQRVLLFAVVDNTDAGIKDLSRLATNKLQVALNDSDEIVCTEFDRTSPIVQRAISEGQLLPAYAQAAPTEPAAAITIGHILGMDGVIIATLQALEIQRQPRQVEVTLRGQYFLVGPNYDLEADQPQAAIEAKSTISLTGLSRTLVNYEGSNRPLVRGALADAAYKFQQILAGRSAIEFPEGRAKPLEKKNKWKWLGPVLVVGALALLLSNKGNEREATPEGAVPPTPTSLRVESNAIRLFWNPPPDTELILLKYQIQRSVNNSPWQYIDHGNCDSGRTSWPDFDVSDDNIYQYRIRSVYTNQAWSGWVQFGPVTYTRP